MQTSLRFTSNIWHTFP